MDAVMEVYLAAVQSGSNEPGIFELIFEADIIVQLVLFGLVLMSVVCWAIIVTKWLRLRSASRKSAKFLDAFWNSPRLENVYD